MAGGAASKRPGANAGVSGEGQTDAEVMLRVKAGDDSAFDYLVQKYRRPMVSFMYRMAHNAAAAEDLAQEVFLRVYRSRESYEASAKFTTWLYRIATNLAVNHARDTRHERPKTRSAWMSRTRRAAQPWTSPTRRPVPKRIWCSGNAWRRFASGFRRCRSGSAWR